MLIHLYIVVRSLIKVYVHILKALKNNELHLLSLRLQSRTNMGKLYVKTKTRSRLLGFFFCCLELIFYWLYKPHDS